MVKIVRKNLDTYLSNLLAVGRITFSRDEAEKDLGVPRDSLLKSARRLKRQGKLFSPRSGYYVVIPPQFLKWGAPPPSWFIDDLMRHEELPYYVGLLKAAELHGASHQAVMEFQIVTHARLPKLNAGRSTIAFYYRQSIGELASAIEDRKTDTGTMRISSPELTALDLVRYPHAAGGLDGTLAVLSEIGPKMDGGKLAVLCPKFENSVRQRLGYLFSKAGHLQIAEIIHASLLNERLFRWVELDPAQSGVDPDLASGPIIRDSRWRLIVRRAPEADEQ